MKIYKIAFFCLICVAMIFFSYNNCTNSTSSINKETSIMTSSLYSGRFHQYWIGPDFMKGKQGGNPSLSKIDFSSFTQSEDWKESRLKSSFFQFRIGFLARLFEPLPIKDRSDFGKSDCRKKPDFDFNSLEKIISLIKKDGVKISVEVGGLNMSSWYAARTDNKGNEWPTSILENFEKKGVGLGAFSAQIENHILNCFEKEFSAKIEYLLLDNSIFMRSFVSTQLDDEFIEYPAYNLSEIHKEVILYMSEINKTRPQLQFGITEFPLEVASSSEPNRIFTTLDKYKEKYKEKFGELPDFQLKTMLKTLTSLAKKQNILFDAFFIDSSNEWEQKDRLDKTKPAKAFERILTAEAIARSYDLKVGLYLESAIKDRRVCDSASTFPSNSCALVMKNLKICDSPAVQPCALNEEELTAPNGEKYATMSLDTIAEVLGNEVRLNIFSYLEQYLKLNGQAEYFLFKTWHPFPEINGPEGREFSWLDISKDLSRKLVPQNPPIEKNPISNLYHLPGKTIGQIKRATNSTCLFKNYENYQAYLRDHNITDTSKLIFLGNPPSALKYEGSCK